MQKKRYRLILSAIGIAAMLLAWPNALAEGDDADTDEGNDGVSYAEEAVAPQIKVVEGKLEVATAANAAQLLRGGGDSEAYRYWETCWGHVPKRHRIKKVTVSLLKNAVGLKEDATPVGREGIKLQPCYEVPLPVAGEVLQKELDFNLHGSIYSNSPLTSVTAMFQPKGGKDKDGATATVTFDPASNVTSYSLVSKTEPVEGRSLDAIMDASTLSVATYTFTLTATSSAQTSPVTLHSAEVKVEKVDAFKLEQNKFDDNYSEAFAFFGGDTSQFLFNYWLRGDRDVSTATEWRDAHLVDSPFGGRCHVMALPYFEKAKEYIDSTYIKVDVLHRSGSVREGKVMPLKTIMDNDASPYVPRFQSNMEYVSHHCLGTAIDVNETLYPNLNIITNHDLIGDDVKNHLRFDGIRTDDKGQQYYSFFYDGAYTSMYKRVPKTIINYLLYELAFYRAGFQWGFYYETACDAMHFMLSENDPNKHMDSETGLRKIYDYIGQEPAETPEPAQTETPDADGTDETAETANAPEPTEPPDAGEA